MNKIFVICNKEEEKERYINLQQQFIKGKFDINNIEYFNHIWKTEITTKKHDDFEFEILNKGEMSCFINHIEIFKKIKNNYDSGCFLILESDAYAFSNMEFTLEK